MGARVKPAANGTGPGVLTPKSMTTLNVLSRWRFQSEA